MGSIMILPETTKNPITLMGRRAGCCWNANITDDEKFAVAFVEPNGEVHIGRIRKLTPRECWRLQGFTDEQFDKAKATGLSDSRLYKMAGNAVTVNVISAIGQIIKKVNDKN